MYSIAAILVVLQFAAAHGSKCISYGCFGRIFEHPILRELDKLLIAKESSSDPLDNLNAIEYLFDENSFEGPKLEILDDVLALEPIAADMEEGKFLCKTEELKILIQAEKSIYKLSKQYIFGGHLNPSHRLEGLVMEVSDKFIEHCVNVIRDQVEKLPSPVGKESSEDLASIFDEMAVFDLLLSEIQRNKKPIPMLEYLSIKTISDDQWFNLIVSLVEKRLYETGNVGPEDNTKLLTRLIEGTCKMLNEQNETKRQLEDALSFALDVELSFEGRKLNPGHNFGERLGRYYLCKIALADLDEFLVKLVRSSKNKHQIRRERRRFRINRPHTRSE